MYPFFFWQFYSMSDNSPSPPPNDDSDNSRSPTPRKDDNDASPSPSKDDEKVETKDDNDGKKDDSVSLYVGNLAYKTDETVLEELFKPLGTILGTKIVRYSGNRNESRGYGFITVSDRETAERMIDKLNGTQFDGRKISVEIARGKQKNRRQPPRRDRYSRDRDRYSRRDRYDRRRRDNYDDYSPRRSRRYDYDDYSPRRRDDYDDRDYRSDRRRRGRYD